jgi:type I restriction-modification system DNA methylase subunit
MRVPGSGEFQTPHDVCDLMVSMLPPEARSVLEPTPGEGNLVQALLRRDCIVTAPEEFWDVNNWFDAIVMNPPFTPMQVGYDIFYRCMEMTCNIIALMPWVTIINSQQRTRDVLDYGLESITHLPRNVFPGSRVQACILQMSAGYAGETRFYFHDRNTNTRSNR